MTSPVRHHHFDHRDNERRSAPMPSDGNPARTLKSEIKIPARYRRMVRDNEDYHAKLLAIDNALEGSLEQH